MSDGYTATATVSLLTGTATDRTVTETTTETSSESFWAEVALEAGASDTSLKLNLLTDPTALLVIGGTGISFKIGGTGTDAVRANPFAYLLDVDEGLGISDLLLSNSDSQPHDVTVICFE